MGFGWAEVAGGVGSLIGTVAQDHYNRRAANQQRDWEYNMSGSAHQREVKDLKAAGLNPILSAGGQGASTPQGATMTPPTISMPGVMEVANLKLAQQKNQLDGQRVLNETQNTANNTALTNSTIAKNLTSSELDKVNTLATKGGIGTKFLGTDVFKKLDQPVFKEQNMPRKKYNPLNPPGMNQPNIRMGSPY